MAYPGVQEASPGTAKSLQEFDYPPVAAVSMSYPMSAIREDRKDAAGKLPGVCCVSSSSSEASTGNEMVTITAMCVKGQNCVRIGALVCAVMWL